MAVRTPVEGRERSPYTSRCRHAVLADGNLAGGQALALELLGLNSSGWMPRYTASLNRARLASALLWAAALL